MSKSLAIFPGKSPGQRGRLLLCLPLIALTVAPSVAISEDSRNVLVTVSSMKQEFGETVYELHFTLKNPQGWSRQVNVTASKSGGPCEGLFVGDDSVKATHTASTITLTKGTNVCRLGVRKMY